jgi:hypothetical protein
LAGVALVAAIRSPGDILRVTRRPERPLLDTALPLLIETAPSLLTAIAIAAAIRPLRRDGHRPTPLARRS